MAEMCWHVCTGPLLISLRWLSLLRSPAVLRQITSFLISGCILRSKASGPNSIHIFSLAGCCQAALFRGCKLVRSACQACTEGSMRVPFPHPTPQHSGSFLPGNSTCLKLRPESKPPAEGWHRTRHPDHLGYNALTESSLCRVVGGNLHTAHTCGFADIPKSPCRIIKRVR